MINARRLENRPEIRSNVQLLDIDSNDEHIFPNVDKCVMAAAMKHERPFSCPLPRKIIMRPAHLLRATTAVLPAAAPSIARSAWAVASDVGLRPVRGLGPTQGEVTTREIAAMLVCRLVGDSKPEIAAFAEHLGRLQCVRPHIVTDGRSPFAEVWGVPEGWRQTAALPAGHSFIDLIEALVVDALAGRFAEGEHWLRYLELRFHRPALMAELRLADAGRDVLDAGGHQAAAIAPLVGLRACYCVESRRACRRASARPWQPPRGQHRSRRGSASPERSTWG